MLGIASYAPVVDYLSGAFPDADFMLVDIGCSGGIDLAWRRFGPRLQALGVDPVVDEIERLRRAETNPRIHYLTALAGLPEGHPFVKRRGNRGYWGRSSWDRLSAAKSLEIVKSEEQPTASEMLAANRWPEMRLSDEVMVIPAYLQDHGTASVDFLKIDVDGADFEVLNSFDLALDTLGVLGVGIEVIYYGSAYDTDNTFHNVDRFMKARGFEIFGLTVARYSVASLPSRYVSRLPTETEFGRPIWGDALYVRDLGSHEYDNFAARLTLAKLLNLICIFATFNLPDCASEIALRFRGRLHPACDVDRILNLLALQAQGPVEEPLSYRAYMGRFESHDPMFFTQSLPLGPESEAGELHLKTQTEAQADPGGNCCPRMGSEKQPSGVQTCTTTDEWDGNRQKLQSSRDRISAKQIITKFEKMKRFWFMSKRLLGRRPNE